MEEWLDTMGAFASEIGRRVVEALSVAPQPEPMGWPEICLYGFVGLAIIALLPVVLLRARKLSEGASKEKRRQEAEAAVLAAQAPMTSSDFEEVLGRLLQLHNEALIPICLWQKHGAEVMEASKWFLAEAREAPVTKLTAHRKSTEVTGALAIRSKSLVMELAWRMSRMSGGGDEYRSYPDDYIGDLYVKSVLAGVDISSRSGPWWKGIREWSSGLSVDLLSLNEAHVAAQARDRAMRQEQEEGSTEKRRLRDEQAIQQRLNDVMRRSQCP